MSLNFDVSKIANYKANYPDRVVTEMGKPVNCWNSTTEAIVWTMMAIDMTKITADNALEVYTRIHAWGAAFGGGSITYADVVGHVGLSTNVFPQKTRKQFEAKLGAARLQESAWQATQEQKEHEKTLPAPPAKPDMSDVWDSFKKTQTEGETVRHFGKIAHSTTKAEGDRQTDFRYCSQCRDWFEPAKTAALAEMKNKAS